MHVAIEPNCHSKVSFTQVVGFRVLYERDLLDWWTDECNQGVGCVFRILEGGWLCQELRRERFTSHLCLDPLDEYLVLGNDYSVSVLCGSTPQFTVR